METLHSHEEARTVPGRPISPEVVIPLTGRLETYNEELELIEMRYQQSLALAGLEDLFAEGQFGG
jgi:hypothetical protein